MGFTDGDWLNLLQKRFPVYQNNPKIIGRSKVTIIVGAGFACASDLQEMGYSVIVYEQDHQDRVGLQTSFSDISI